MLQVAANILCWIFVEDVYQERSMACSWTPDTMAKECLKSILTMCIHIQTDIQFSLLKLNNGF